MDTNTDLQYQSYLELYEKNKHYPSIVKMSFEEWLENHNKLREQQKKALQQYIEQMNEIFKTEDTNIKTHITIVDLDKEYHCDTCKTKVDPKCSRTYFIECGVYCEPCVEEHSCKKCNEDEDEEEEE